MFSRAPRFSGNARSDSRTPTNSTFGKRPTRTNLPPKKPEPELKVEDDPVPTYAHADKQTGAIDKDGEDKGKEDESVRESQGKNPRDREQPKTEFKPATKTVKDNQRNDQPHTDHTVEDKSDYEKYWALITDYNLEEEVNTDKNSWNPNCLAMFEILEATGSFVYNNRIAVKHHSEYLDYGVACYYAIIFYIQILRAKEAAGQLTGEDSSFYRRFTRKFKLEELPISGILVPYFNTIVSTLLPDSKYNWIIPDYNEDILMANVESFGPKNGSCFIQPMVPYMLGILRTAITKHTQDNLTAEHAGEYVRFDEYDDYVTQRITDDRATTLFGMGFRQNETITNDRNTFFSAAGISYRFHADAETLAAAAPKWRKSSFQSLRFAAVGSTERADQFRGQPLVSTGQPINRLDAFLGMEKQSDLEWFSELIRQAATHARFFNSVSTLSDIYVTGGMETLVTTKFKKIDAATRTEIVHAGPGLGLRTDANNTTIGWYPTTFRDYVASFYTTREGVKREETFQAMTFGTNGSINITSGDDRVGGTYDTFRFGSYWTNKEWAATKFKDSGILGVPMFRGWKTMHQSKSALVKPTGY